MNRRTMELCFREASAVDLGRANQQYWFLVSGAPDPACAASGDPTSARLYTPPVEALNTVG